MIAAVAMLMCLSACGSTSSQPAQSTAESGTLHLVNQKADSADSHLVPRPTSTALFSATSTPLPALDGVAPVMPERIIIPAIDLDTPVTELGWYPSQNSDGRIFSEWEVADHAAGWHRNSSLLGQGGNVVLSGHNNIYGAVFRELDQLQKGDEALLWANGDTYRYLIDKVMIVPEKYATQEQREENAAWIGDFDDDRLTLVSCWPRDDNSHRIIVVARPLKNY